MSDAIPYETIVERVKDDIDYIAGSAYAKGYNTAKSEIALSGEYERAYMRGKKDALRWIPCSERLPEDGQNVLVAYRTTDKIRPCQYHDDGSRNPWYSYLDNCRAYSNVVIAWMPLPEPYKEGIG